MNTTLVKLHTTARARLASDRGSEVVAWVMMAILTLTLATALAVGANTLLDGKISEMMGM